MDIEKTSLQDLLILRQKQFDDRRGFLRVAFREDELRDAGLPFHIAQVNHSRSLRGVIRGLHFQYDPPLDKIIRVIHGRIYAVYVDVRKRSQTLGKWVGLELSEERTEAVYAPFGFAAGFCVLTEYADVEYLYNAGYNPSGESNIVWNDPQLAIEWPLKLLAGADPIVSDRDRAAQTFEQWMKRPESEQ